MNRLVLSVIRATSPSLAESLKACRLRAAMSRTAGSAAYVLGNPKAWLGTAYHEVLQKIAAAESSGDAGAAAERLWDAALAAQYRRNLTHPLDRRFGAPAAWPGYHLVRASALLRAREIVASGGGDSSGNGSAAGTIRERKFEAFGGKLVGKPDVIREGAIVDYKSGAILEYDETSQSDVVKSAYVRQLRIYGFLVKEVLGWWPARGVLLPFVGVGVQVRLEPNECEREATEAVALLDDYNGKVTTGITPTQIANPSPSTCKWCSFKLACPAFWSSVGPEWSGLLDGAAVEGVLREPPRRTHGGAAMSLAVEVQNGSEGPQHVQLAPLNPNIHAALTALNGGDHVRVVGLRTGPDGSLMPTARTVLTAVGNLPTIEFAAQRLS